MTRRHYVMLAEALKGARRPAGVRVELSDHNRGVDWAARNVADSLAADNPRFDRARFLRDAGVAP